RLDPGERRILVERRGGEVEKPRAYEAYVLPDAGDLPQVEAELALRLHQGEPLGVGLHQAVLDAVVDHLHEVARTDRPDAPPASVRGRRQRNEGRLQPIDDLGRPADHQAVPVLETPDAAARPLVDVVDAPRGEGAGPADIIFIVC